MDPLFCGAKGPMPEKPTRERMSEERVAFLFDTVTRDPCTEQYFSEEVVELREELLRARASESSLRSKLDGVLGVIEKHQPILSRQPSVAEVQTAFNLILAAVSEYLGA